MQKKFKPIKIPILIGLFVLMIAAFTLVYGLTDRAAAPDEDRGIFVPVPPDEPETTDDPDDPDDPEPADEPVEPVPADDPVDDPTDDPTDDPVIEGFITVQMDASDISAGNLILVNHDYGYDIPADLDLVNITNTKTGSYRVQDSNFRLLRSVIEPLDEMMADFQDATRNTTVAIISAYRSYDNQQRILNGYISRLGRREALLLAALPGHSEHHTGLSIDFGIIESGVRRVFQGTGNTAWFRRNSYKYGFILRYPQGKVNITNTSHEPWHFRYVGLLHAYIMFQKNFCLEEYIDFLAGYSYDEPFEFLFEDEFFELYFVQGTEIPVPVDCVFDITGTNTDGFIVTLRKSEDDYYH